MSFQVFRRAAGRLLRCLRRGAIRPAVSTWPSALRAAALAALLSGSAAANAYAECMLTPKQYYTDVNDLLWVCWDEGGCGKTVGTNPGTRSILATAILAITTGRMLRVRYEDGAVCDGSSNPLLGVWFIK